MSVSERERERERSVTVHTLPKILKGVEAPVLPVAFTGSVSLALHALHKKELNLHNIVLRGVWRCVGLSERRGRGLGGGVFVSWLLA